jgi:hypothetical protein
MWLVISRTVAFLVTALVVAACGAQRAAPPVTGHVPPSAAGQNGPAAFVTRARQVTAQWDRSQVARVWRTGLVLMDASDLTAVPSNAGFSSQGEKLAFVSGQFRLAAVLPAGPLPGIVRWADGTTLRLPSLTARAAFADLATERPCGPYPCGQLTVTGAEPGVLTVRTSRGLASVPAWRFTVAGLGWKVSEVAVARSSLVVVPGYGPSPPAGGNTPGVSAVTAVSGDGRVLTLGFIGSACDAAWGGYRYQSGGTVVVGSWERPSAGNAPCPAVGVFRTARVTLARPLGTRVVLDVASGLPLVPGLQTP